MMLGSFSRNTWLDDDDDDDDEEEELPLTARAKGFTLEFVEEEVTFPDVPLDG